MSKTPKDRHAGIKRVYEIAAAEFLRSGKIPQLILSRHCGTGFYQTSWLPEDCENGMLEVVYRVPPNRNHRKP